MGQCPTCQVGLSAPRDISKQSIKVCTARKLVIQPGAVAAAPVRKETAGRWASRGRGGTPAVLNSSDSSAGPEAAGRALRAEGQTAGKPATRWSATPRSLPSLERKATKRVLPWEERWPPYPHSGNPRYSPPGPYYTLTASWPWVPCDAKCQQFMSSPGTKGYEPRQEARHSNCPGHFNSVPAQWYPMPGHGGVRLWPDLQQLGGTLKPSL